MTRRLAALLTAGLVLSACGTQSPASAMRAWVTQSAFHTAVATLRSDAGRAVTALRDASTAPNVLHTVCGVLDVDALSANASLPTPDDQATALLGRAYGAFGSGAAICYTAASSAAARVRAVAEVQRAARILAEASARVAAAS
ncbi:MAG: hypothetical protein ACHQFZ_09430 [Acidimicrobiales bacterium]